MNSLLKAADRLFFPPGMCMACGTPRDTDEQGLCPDCRARLSEIRVPAESCPVCLSRIPRGKACPFCSSGSMEGLDAQYAPFQYREPARAAVHALKFRHDLRAADMLAPFMADSLTDRGFDCIVPVPLHRARCRERGYNQSLVLARRVSVITGIPVREDLLFRPRKTRAQSTLSYDQRARNVEGAFLGTDGARGLRVLLLDDVRTGGSTARGCAKALREKGAAGVSLLTACVVWTAAEHDHTKARERSRLKELAERLRGGKKTEDRRKGKNQDGSVHDPHGNADRRGKRE